MEISKRRVSFDMPETKKLKKDSIVEQDDINYIIVPSLEIIAITSILSRLLKQSDLQNALQKHASEFFRLRRYSEETRRKIFHQTDETISEKLSLLSLPNSLKAKITDVIRPIGLQILKWMNIFVSDYSVFPNSLKNINSIQWTMVGTIDEVETLKFLISNTNLTENNVNAIYIIACNYCLEDYLPKLWVQMPQKFECNDRLSLSSNNNHLVCYWTSFLRNELSGLMNILKPFDDGNLYDCKQSINVNMLTWSIFHGNAISMKYFWFKLTEEEQRENAIIWVEKVMVKYSNIRQIQDYLETNEYTDILCFLLSHLHKDEQRDIFKKDSVTLLKIIFMHWPWQEFVVPTIQAMWDYLDKEKYVKFLSYVVQQIQRHRCTEKILNKLWCNSPKYFKKYYIHCILNDSFSIRLLVELFDIENIDSIKLLLNEATVDERKRIIFNIITLWGNINLLKLISMDKLHLLDMLVNDILSESQIFNLKGKLAKVIGHRLCHDWILGDDWQAVGKFLKWNFSSQGEVDYFKRNIIKKFEIMDDLIRIREFEVMNKFMFWSCNSREEINLFQRELTKKMGKCRVLLTRVSCKD